MIIDSHFHTGFHGYTPDSVIAYMDKYNIHKCWLLTWEEADPAIRKLYNHLKAEDVLEAREKYPDRIVPFYAPDPSRKDFREIMDDYLSKGFKGVGELKVKYRWDSYETDQYLQYVNQKRLPLVFHMEVDRYHFISPENTLIKKIISKSLNGGFNGISRKYIENFIARTGLFKKQFQNNLVYFPGYLLDFQSLEEKVAQYKGITYIAHGPHVWNNISSDVDSQLTLNKGKVNQEGIIGQLLSKYPNLYADISGRSGYNALTRDKAFSKIFLEKYAHKLLYGTDNSLLNQQELIKSFKLPAYKEKQMFFENACKIMDNH